MPTSSSSSSSSPSVASVSVIARKYIGSALLLSNVVYGSVLYALHGPFALLVHQFVPFFAAYAFSLLLALFSVRFHLPLLLLPLLITTVPFVVVPLLIASLFLSHHFCLLIPPLFAPLPNASSPAADFPPFRSPPNSAALSAQSVDCFHSARFVPTSAVVTFFLAIIFVEKSAEFLFFLNLKRLFLQISKQQKNEKEILMERKLEKTDAAEEKADKKEHGEKQKGKKRKSSFRQKSIVEDREEDGRSEEEEEEMVYGKELHHTGGTKAKPRSAIPTVSSSKRVIA
ncbi:hypothetical protein niasHT_023469 [Heterodera trifolii]|uniref:Transmembrane protein n=1 Tax=Heterodera trifolii TaxID=157864 RepID=A0ABD2JJE2_9BILA